jgi:hypothetical protein
MMPSSFRTVSVARRRVLSLAAGATALAAASPLRRATAQVTPRDIAGAGRNAGRRLGPAAAEHAGRRRLATIPRRGRGALVAAMQAHQVPGAAIGLLAGDREELLRMPSPGCRAGVRSPYIERSRTFIDPRTVGRASRGSGQEWPSGLKNAAPIARDGRVVRHHRRKR